jgi:putative endonuclease
VLQDHAARRSYVGITTDLPRRLEQHNGALPGGARSTRAGRPWSLAALYGPFPDRAEASRQERRLKQRRGEARLRADWLPRLG